MNRIVAIAPAPRGFGYAVFEGPELIDWGLKGTSRLRGRHHAWCVRQAERLFEEFVPEVLAVNDHHDRRFRRGEGSRHLLEEIARQAGKRGVKVRRLRHWHMRSVAAEATGITKYKVAVAVAQRFPELAWRLPPVRKPWMSEDARMGIFDAVALGLAHYGTRRKPSVAA
jgi:hypothetical protein